MDEIIKVTFHQPRQGGEREFFFTSLAAVYQKFTPDEIGVGLSTLWSYGVTPDHPKSTRTCVISKHYIHRKPQANKRK